MAVPSRWQDDVRYLQSRTRSPIGKVAGADDLNQVFNAWSSVRQVASQDGSSLDLLDLLKTEAKYEKAWPEPLNSEPGTKFQVPDRVELAYGQSQASSRMGALPELRMAWAAVDNRLFMWHYDRQEQPMEWSSTEQAITHVALTKNPRGLRNFAQLSLVVCTASEIIRLFLQPINDHSENGDYFQLVEPMGYRIPSCLIYMGCSATLGDRLFLGGNDGHLYELQHSKGHPSMRLVNLTSGWRDLMPGFVRTQWLSWASVQTMTMDRERNLLYVAHVNGLLKDLVQLVMVSGNREGQVLGDNMVCGQAGQHCPGGAADRDNAMGTAVIGVPMTLSAYSPQRATVYDLGKDGTGKPSELYTTKDLAEAARNNTKGRDIFKEKSKSEIVMLAPISKAESSRLLFMALTKDSRRAYFGTTLPLRGNDRPKPDSISLLAARDPLLPLRDDNRGLNVSAACYQGGTLVMSDVDEQGTQSRILVVTKDLSRPTEAGLGSQQAIPDLRETVAALDKGTTSVRGIVQAIVPNILGTPRAAEVGNYEFKTELATQHMLPPQSYEAVGTGAVQGIVKHRPVELLRHMIQRNQMNSIKGFFQLCGTAEGCAMAVQLAVAEEGIPAAVQRRARELLEDPSPDLGGEATTKEQSGQALTSFGVRCEAAGTQRCEAAGTQRSFGGTTLWRQGAARGRDCVLGDLWSAVAATALPAGGVVTNDQQDWSPAFRGICLYFQRLARPLDEVNLFRAIGAVPSGKAPLQLEVGLSLGAIQALHSHFRALAAFLTRFAHVREERLRNPPRQAQPQLQWHGARGLQQQDPGESPAKRRRIASARHEELNSLKQVLALTERIAQSLSLLAVLQHKGVHLLSVKLDEEQRAALARTTLQSWAVRRDGDTLAHTLMWALLNEEQGASDERAKGLATDLASVAPAIFKAGDRVYADAMRFVRAAETAQSPSAAAQHRDAAVNMLCEVPLLVDLQWVTPLLANLGGWAGIVQLAQAKAQALDPAGRSSVPLSMAFQAGEEVRSLRERRISECYGPLLQLVKGLRNPQEAQDAIPAELIQNPLARQQRLRQLVRERGQAEASVSDVGLQPCLQARDRGGQSSSVVTVSPVTVERQVVQDITESAKDTLLQEEVLSVLIEMGAVEDLIEAARQSGRTGKKRIETHLMQCGGVQSNGELPEGQQLNRQQRVCVEALARLYHREAEDATAMRQPTQTIQVARERAGKMWETLALAPAPPEEKALPIEQRRDWLRDARAEAYDSGRDAWKDALECRVQSADLQMAIAERLRSDLQTADEGSKPALQRALAAVECSVMELQELYSVAVPQRYWDVCLQLADAAGQGNRLEPRDLQELWKLYLLQGAKLLSPPQKGTCSAAEAAFGKVLQRLVCIASSNNVCPAALQGPKMLASREGACTPDQAEAAFGEVLQRLRDLGPHIHQWAMPLEHLILRLEELAIGRWPPPAENRPGVAQHAAVVDSLIVAREVMGPSQGNRDSGLTQVERAYDALLERQQGDPEGGQEAREPFMRARLMHSRVRLLHLRGTTDDIRMSEAWAWNKRDEKINDLRSKIDHYRRTAPAQLSLPDSNELVAALDDLVELIDRQEQDAEIRHPRPLRQNQFPSLLHAARRF
eukprot:jgi/Astpho2/6724/Aster-06743